MNNNWIFADPPNVAVITTVSILEARRPILYVSHDKEDGCWQFLDGNSVSMNDAKVIAFHRIVSLDSSIKKLADLPFFL